MKLAARGVVSVEALQLKNRWLGDEGGAVASGIATRRRVLLAAELFEREGRDVRFVTFTFAPGREFDSAESCWDAVFSAERRVWGEFLRRVEGFCPGCHVFMAMEPHPGKGEGGEDLPHKGWPHFHALFFIPKGQRLDYGELWRSWGFGGVRAEVPKKHAVAYCCKYVTKGYEGAEFFERDGDRAHVHMIRTTHRFWDRVNVETGQKKRRKPEGWRPVRRREVVRSIRQIRADRGKHLHTLLRYEDPATERTYYHRIHQMDISTFTDMMSAAGFLGGALVDDKLRAATGRAAFALGGRERSERNLDYSKNCGAALVAADSS